MAGHVSARGPDASPVLLTVPFTGRWLVRNSPARRVPSHGTDLFGERYAIDFVGVDDRHRTAGTWDWRTVLATEPPERFVGFGRPILAPADGVVVAVHDGEPDHAGRRSQLALAGYLLGQAARVRAGVGAVAGNHVVISLPDGGGFVAMVHLQCGSIAVRIGQEVAEGQPIARCGSSGNSTQPHLYLQVMDSADLMVARGVPMAFRRFDEWRSRHAPRPELREQAVPGEGAVIERLSG